MAPCVPPAKCLLGFWVVGDLYLFWFELWTVPQPTCVFYMCCWVLWVVVESSRRLIASRAGMDGWHPQKSLPWKVPLSIFFKNFRLFWKFSKLPLTHTHTLHPYLLFCFPESVNIFVGNGFLCSHIYPRYGEKKTQFGLKMTTTTPQPIIFLSTWIRPQSKYFSSPQWTLYIIHVTLNSNEFLCFPFLFSFPFQWKAETNDTVLCGFCSRRVQRAKHISFKHISR